MKKFIQASLPLLSLLASCVDGSSNKISRAPSGINQNESIQADGSNVQGIYAAEIWPINTNLHLKNIGSVGVERDGDSFKAMVRLKYGPKSVRVKQAVYLARRCPNINDDLNKDAYVDIQEARQAIGKMVIPFDENLDSQSEGMSDFPSTDASGKMFWSESASFERLFQDLKAVDANPDDELMKLKEEEGITLPGRIVLFQGASATNPLPETVGSTDGESRYSSLPVGCAVLWKVEAMPTDLVGTSNP